MALKPGMIALLWALTGCPFLLTAQQENGLSLKDCIDYAIAHNITVQQNQLAKKQTKANLQQSKMGRLPTLNAGAGQSFRFGRSVDPFTNEFVQETIRSNNFSLNSGVDLFKGFQQNREIKSNTRQLQADRAKVEATKNTIRTEVASRYLEVLLQRENVALSKEQLAASKSQLKQARLLVESGKAPKSRLLEVKAQVSSERSSLVEAKNQYKMAKLDLRQYMNWDKKKEQFRVQKLDIPDSLEALPDKPVEAVVQQNFERLPRLEQARYNLQAARYNYKAAKSGRYPTLSFNARLSSGFSSRRQTPSGIERTIDTVGFVASSEDPVVRPSARPVLETPNFTSQLENNFSQALSFNLNIPIFNNLNIETRITNSKIQMQQAALKLARKKQNVRKAINKAYSKAQNAYRQYQAASEQLQTQQALYNQAQARYREGDMNYYDWRKAKQDYSRAQNNYLQAKYRYLFNKKLYGFYLGKPLRLNF